MNYETVYEISRFQFPTELISAIFIVMITGFLLWEHIEKYKECRKFSNMILIILLSIMVLSGIFLTIISVSSEGGEMQSYSKLYYSGEYEIVEGQVHSLKETNYSQDYFVNDTYFHISKMDETIWFIEKDGQYVRISYIPGNLKENVYHEIVKLEIAD